MKFAVALFTHMDGALNLRHTVASNWFAALESCFPEYADCITSRKLSDARNEAGAQDWEFDVVCVDGPGWPLDDETGWPLDDGPDDGPDEGDKFSIY